jgi:transposase
MKGLLLTRYERETLEQQREMARKNDKLDLFLKINSILAVADGRLQKEVAGTLGVPLRTLEWWIERYRNDGLTALLKGPYPGRQPRLTTHQKEELAQIIKDGPESAGLETGVWTALIVKSLIKARFGVKYGESQVRRILQKLGFSLQLPRRSPSKADPVKQQHWIEEEFPEIKEEVQSDAGVMGYQDEASFQQAGSITRTWCLRGEGCDVKSYPTRKSIKVLGAVVLAQDPKWHFRFTEKFNGESFLTLLEQLVRQYSGKKIHLITDNAPYHRKGAKVNQWLEKHASSIKLHFLPAYSPEFNAVEYIWRKIKRLTTHNRYFETPDKLHAELFRRFNRFQGNPASLRSTVAGFT